MKRRKLGGPTQAEVDRVWSSLIKQRDGRCRLCGSTRQLNAHHILGKRSRVLRYSLLNGLTLCAGCHLGRVHSPNGRVALDVLRQIQVVMGPGLWDALLELENDRRKMSLVEALENLTA